MALYFNFRRILLLSPLLLSFVYPSQHNNNFRGITLVISYKLYTNKQLVANTRELHHAQRRRGFENVIKNNLLQKKKNCLQNLENLKSYS